METCYRLLKRFVGQNTESKSMLEYLDLIWIIHSAVDIKCHHPRIDRYPVVTFRHDSILKHFDWGIENPYGTDNETDKYDLHRHWI